MTRQLTLDGGINTLCDRCGQRQRPGEHGWREEDHLHLCPHCAATTHTKARAGRVRGQRRARSSR